SGAVIAVVARRAVGCVHAADRRVAGLGRAPVAVIAVGRRAAHAGAARAPIRRRAGIAVVAPLSVRGADARPGRAGVAGGAGIEIVARQGVWRVHAAGHRVARVGRAHVAVDAVGRRAADADAARTGVRRGAGAAVVAGERVRGAPHARGGAVAGAATDAGVVGAGLAGRLELAGRRAAVAGHEVAVVALLAEVHDAVAADVGDLADEDGELVGLQSDTREARSLNREDVLAAGAAGDGLGRGRIADEPGRRWGCQRGQERSHPTGGERRPERQRRPRRPRRNASAVLTEVHRSHGIGLEHLHAVRVRDRVRPAGRPTEDADADATEHDLITRERHGAVREGALELVVQHGLDGPDGDRADRSGIEELDREVVGKGDGTGRIGYPQRGVTCQV